MKLAACSLFVSLVGLATPAHSDPIEVSFSGVIDQLDDPDGLLPAGISIGTPFSGTYSYDSSAGGPPVQVVPGFYQFPADPTASLSVDVGGNVFDLTLPTQIFIGDDYSSPSLGVIDYWATSFPVLTGVQPGVVFVDTTLTRISDPTQYFVNESTAGWTSSRFSLSNSEVPGPAGAPVLASGEILLLEGPTPVPTVGPFALGLLLVALVAGAVAAANARLRVAGGANRAIG